MMYILKKRQSNFLSHEIVKLHFISQSRKGKGYESTPIHGIKNSAIVSENITLCKI